MQKTGLLACLVALCLGAAMKADAGVNSRTIIYEERVTQIGAGPVGSEDLWVTLKDLTRATGYELKPQGVCRDDLCFPIPKDKKNKFLSKRASVTWFNLSEFARLVGQAVAYDRKHSVWHFGPRAEVQNSYLESLEAPDFTLPDMNGRMRSLLEFRGKKVLLLTWASW